MGPIGWEKLPQIIAGFLILGVINLLGWLVKYLIDGYKEKSKKSDQGLKDLQSQLEKKLDQFSSIITSYMETTIRLSDKMENVEKHLDGLMKLDSKLKRMNSAIKLIAGEDWPRIKSEITDDDL